MKMPRLAGKVCLVTGATRGIGKGIALHLADCGATVYVTGRTLKRPLSGTAGSLEDTAAEIEARGGKCIAVQCDHSRDEDIQRLFERIKSEQDGRLDICVNNAYSAVMGLMKYLNVPYWEQPVSIWDDVNIVGLRNHYACAVHAARMMVPLHQGLIVNISSPGGLSYLFNVAYGVGKDALDRMSVDCAVELRKHNVACVSLWPAAVMTEIVGELKQENSNKTKEFTRHYGDGTETPEFSGIAIAHLATDPSIMNKSGRVLMTGDLADEYGFVDIDGSTPNHFRSWKMLMPLVFPRFPYASFFPRWLKVPRWMLALYGSKL